MAVPPRLTPTTSAFTLAALRLHAVAVFGYACVALAFAWPLALHLSSALPGPVSGDTGVYVWNLWVFRHAIVAHREMPFFTLEILALSPAMPLTLQNYTTLANVIAFPLLPMLGIVATFNLLVIGAGVVSAYAMFVCARRLTGDTAASWVAGLAFGFCPFMSARAMEHFSLVQTAPLPIFVMLFERIHFRPNVRVAIAVGLTVACAFLCDPYYAVYCLLIGAFAIVYSAALIQRGPVRFRPYRSALALDIVLVCLAGLIAGMLLGGGRRIQILSVRISMTRLYTPVLIFTVLALARVWLAVRARVSWVFPTRLPSFRVVAVAGLACTVLLSPVLSALVGAAGESQWTRPPVFWQSSAPGLDLFALFVPNPMHPWFGRFFAEAARTMPGGFVENVGSIPWTLLAVLVAAAASARAALPRYWIAFTVFVAMLSLGPFVRIGGVMTYVPTPWALLRYVPIIGAARMPPRMMALVMLGLSLLLAFALRELRARLNQNPSHPRRATALTGVVACALLFEMLPAPRTLHSAAVPSVNRIIAADPRPVRVLNLPFGLRDGLSSHGNATAAGQYFQTVHEKQLLGGYVSRLPRQKVQQYRRLRVTRVLMDLSEGRPVAWWRKQAAIDQARELMPSLDVGYVVVDTGSTSEELMDFARSAFDLTRVTSDGPYVLYRTPLAPPLTPSLTSSPGPSLDPPPGPAAAPHIP
jgi:hypothetical protein